MLIKLLKIVISIYFFEIFLYNDTLALLVICHIVYILIPNFGIYISNLYFVMYDECLLLE